MEGKTSDADALNYLSSDTQIRSLSPAIGAEIIGVDLSKPISDSIFDKILNAWHENLIILFRHQCLSEDDQMQFGTRFGPPARTDGLKNYNGPRPKNPAILLISNVRENGELIGALPDGEMHFHTDQCHQEKPSMASMLYAIEIPQKGGNTLFANMYRAYETLPDKIKSRVKGLKAINAYDYQNSGTKRGTKLREGISSWSHPIAKTHPITGKKFLYVNRLMTVAIEGLPDAESDELLNLLFDHQERSEFIYEHVWQPGDVVLWDNLCTLHARTDFSADERRLLRRMSILYAPTTSLIQS